MERTRYFVTNGLGEELPPIDNQKMAQAALDDGLHVVEEKMLVTYNTTVRVYVSTHYNQGESIE